MTPAQAMASAFAGDPVAYTRGEALGRAHALAGHRWSCPEGVDMLAYSLGYQRGEAERACCGEQEQPETEQ